MTSNRRNLKNRESSTPMLPYLLLIGLIAVGIYSVLTLDKEPNKSDPAKAVATSSKATTAP